MNLSDCKHGILVKRTNSTFEHTGQVGMIVGIGQNLLKEPIPLIQWQDGAVFTIHPRNIEELKGE